MKSGQSSRRRTVRYFTTGRATNQTVLTDLENLKEIQFRIPPGINDARFIEQFRVDQQEDRERNRSGLYLNHQNYRSRLHLHLAERLCVPEGKELPGKSITEDIDPDFFTLVTGRKIKSKKNIREYTQDLRNCFFTRLKIGYYDDEILKAKEQHNLEKKRFLEIKEKFETYLKSFGEFLKSDHSSSLVLLKGFEMERKRSEEAESRVKELSEDLKKLEAEVLVIHEKWRDCRRYQKFLYGISPSEWRKEHDARFSAPSGRSKVSSVDVEEEDELEEEDLCRNIKRFVQETSSSRPPALYFQHPEQVQHIFHELEKNNVIALIQCDNLEKPIQRMLIGWQKIKQQFDFKQRLLEEEVEYMKESVKQEEEKAEASEEKAKVIVFKFYKEFVVNEENLNILSLVEDVYEDAIAENDYDLSMVAMIKEIEMKYEILLLSLDKHPYQILAPSIRNFYREEKRAEKEAKDAERKVHLMEILLKRLSRSLSYPKKGHRRTIPRRLVRRSEPKREQLKKLDQMRPKTAEERELEYFFGKSCRHVGEAGLYRPLCFVSKTLFPGQSE